jgi:signal transduction histidine kinase
MGLSVWVILHDVAARSRAEAEVRRQRAILQTVLAGMGEGLVVADTQGRFQVFNPMAHALLGIGAGDDAPEKWSSCYGLFRLDAGTPFPPQDLPLVQALQARSVDNVEMVVRRDPATDARIISMTGRPISDESGGFHGGVVVFHDVTEQKQAEQTLRESERALREKSEMLKQSNAELEQFAYVASHDLKEPLRMVASYTGLLAEDWEGTLGPEADQYIRYAVEGAKRMQALIDDLLNYSRVGRIGGRTQPVDLTHLAETVLANLEGSVQANGASVEIGELPTVMGNPMLLGQLLQNLIANAIKFHGDAPPVVQVSSSERGDQWLFAVKDNGIGIEPQYAERIFEVFQRLHGRGEYEGTGIGLAICRKVVEQHGGRIWVESQPGQGSTFYFTMPAEQVTKLKEKEVVLV